MPDPNPRQPVDEATPRPRPAPVETGEDEDIPGEPASRKQFAENEGLVAPRDRKTGGNDDIEAADEENAPEDL